MKYLMRQIPAVLAVAVLLAASTAFATDHNGGFFLRLAGGGSFNSTSITDPSNSKFELSGIGGNLSAAIGGVVKHNLAIHGTVWGWMVGSPDATIDGSDAGTLSQSLNMSAFGGGATYYFMPANIFLTSSMGVGRLHTESGSSDAGFVFDLGLGKEWFMSPTWGLGFNAGMNYHSVPDGGVSQNWSGTSFVLNLCATYN